MTEAQKLSRKQQLAEWRKQQRQKTPEKMAALREKTSRDNLRSRLTFWGVILCLGGTSTAVINLLCLLRGQSTIASALFMLWGVALLGLGITDLISSRTRLLLPTGVAALVHGILILLSFNIFWGPVMIIAGIMMLRDAKKALTREKQKAVEQPDGAVTHEAARSAAP